MLSHFLKNGDAKWNSEKCLKAGDPGSPPSSALNKTDRALHHP